MKIDCSFCGKPPTAVKALLAGPDVYICNECVALCVDVISDFESKKNEYKET